MFTSISNFVAMTVFLFLQKVKVLDPQLCPTPCDPMDCSPPGFSVHGILQARILEWVAIPFSRRSSWSRDQTSFLQCSQILYRVSHQGSYSASCIFFRHHKTWIYYIRRVCGCLDGDWELLLLGQSWFKSCPQGFLPIWLWHSLSLAS